MLPLLFERCGNNFSLLPSTHQWTLEWVSLQHLVMSNINREEVIFHCVNAVAAAADICDNILLWQYLEAECRLLFLGFCGLYEVADEAKVRTSENMWA